MTAPLIPPRLLVTLVFIVVGLLVVVVVVGLIRDTLDLTAVALTLSTMISGIVVGVLTRKPDPSSHDERHLEDRSGQ